MSFFRNNIRQQHVSAPSFHYSYRIAGKSTHRPAGVTFQTGLPRQSYLSFLDALKRLAVLGQFNLPERAWGPRQFSNPEDAKAIITFYARSFHQPGKAAHSTPGYPISDPTTGGATTKRTARGRIGIRPDRALLVNQHKQQPTKRK